jgi:hypothetical protein
VSESSLTSVSGIEPSGDATARTAVNGSGRLHRARLLARALHILLLAALGGAAGGAGCLVTDPVPYEPAENIPPIILASDTRPEPDSLIEFDRDADPPQTEVSLHIVVREYNLDDVLYYKLLRGGCVTPQDDLGSDILRPTGERDRTLDLTLRLTDLSGESCAKFVLAISDRGWSPISPPYCSPPTDDEGKPTTAVARLVWVAWIKDVAIPGGTGVVDCGL